MRDEIATATKVAMKNKDEVELSTLRLMNAAIKELDIEARTKNPDSDEVDDQAIMARFATMIKQRRESADAYKKGNRPEMAEREMQEITVIERFLPRQLSAEEVNAAIDEAIESTEASSIKDMGKVMSALKEQYTGQMDFAETSALVKKRLSEL